MADTSNAQGGEAPPSFDWLPEGCEVLADGEYDAIIVGTGLTDCIMSGLLSRLNMKVLHVDRNGYYGGDCASLSLTELFEKFGKEVPEDFRTTLGANRDYNVDLVPKFIMASGTLVKILVHTRVDPYLQFKQINGSFVMKDGRVHKVPSNAQEAVQSSLMGMFEKRRFRTFVKYVHQYEPEDPSTHEGKDLTSMTMAEVFASFNLDDNTQSFVGHAMALHRDDSYLSRPALETVMAVKLYATSTMQHGLSPYLYPMWGLGGLPESFSRLCAVNQGTFILNCGVSEVLTNADGVAWGIKATYDGKVCAAKARLCVVGDPSYFPADKVRPTGRVVRSICILDHPIRGTTGSSGQIIIPMREARRRHDIYIAFLGFDHQVAPQNRFIAICSTTVETEDPVSELDYAFRLFGNVMERFDAVVDTYEPAGSGEDDRMFISKSYDATSHFETVADDVMDMYKRVTGEDLDLSDIGGAENVEG